MVLMRLTATRNYRFLFHYQYDVGIIKSIDYEMAFNILRTDRDKFDKPLKDALIKVAQIVLGEEIMRT